MAIIHTTVALVTIFAVPAFAAGAQVRPAALEASGTRPAGYGQARGGEQTEPFSRTFQAGPNAALDLSNISGNVTVSGGAGDQIVVAAVKRARDRAGRSAKEQLALVTIEATERGGRVEVRTRYPRDEHNIGVSVDYTVTLPSAATVLARSISGNVTVRNVQGEIRAETVSGQVSAADTGRVVYLKTVSGDAEIRNSPPDAEVTLHSVSGQIVARGLRCRSLEGSTVSGGVELTDAVCERVSVRSISGGISYTGTLARGGRYEFKSHAGDVRLALSPEIGFELDASTFSGSVRSDLPVTPGAMGGEDRRGTRRSLRGTYGDASAVLNLTTFSGAIVIVKR